MFNEDEWALIWFDYNDYNFAKVEQILLKFDSIGDIFNKELIKNAVFDKKSFPELKDKLLNLDFEKFADSVLNQFYKHNISAVTFVSKNYPEKLKTIDQPPLVLYTKGDQSLLNKKSISVVGTRKPTDYGKIVCEKFVKELSGVGLVTVSGLAYGIDTIVAETSLGVGAKTIAVLAGGLDCVYPSQNKDLARRIAENGLLVTEQRLGIKPVQYLFVNRNRIVSGLGLGTLIVEAGEGSGTMTTARFAIEQSRELFVVPGNIYSVQSKGTNALIDEIPDTFTISPNRILERLKIQKKQEKVVTAQVDILEAKILDALENGELSFDDLADITKISSAELSSKLIQMEMFGFVKKGNANTYYKL